ncbi:restriction endonuclease subunit S [Herbaspirillum lusitanum]|uniref:Restriction endonuclease subunit S n=1 Tax=Herbaspirillum lusitanum TaxID=213312 RepID=A0ABW9A818_9BURK
MSSTLQSFLLPVRSADPALVFGENEFTYVDISAINRDQRKIASPQVLTTDIAPSRARQILATGDVIVSTVRPNLNTVALVPESLDGAIASTGFCVLRPDRDLLNERFLFHWLSSESTVRRLVQRATGATYPAVSDKIVKTQLFDPPALAEQRRIARILDKAAGLLQKRQEALRLADEFLMSVFIHMFGDPGSNPKGFDLGTIRDVVASANYGTSEKASQEAGKYPILRMNNITYEGGWDFSSLKYVDLDCETAHKYLAQRGDLLFNRTNSKELVGKTAVYMRDESMAIAGYLVRVRMNGRGNPHYVSGYLNSAHGKRTLAGRAKSIVGMANINAQEMQDIPLLLPPIELQNKYARIVEAVQIRLNTQQKFLRESVALQSALSHQFFGTAEV